MLDLIKEVITDYSAITWFNTFLGYTLTIWSIVVMSDGSTFDEENIDVNILLMVFSAIVMITCVFDYVPFYIHGKLLDANDILFFINIWIFIWNTLGVCNNFILKYERG